MDNKQRVPWNKTYNKRKLLVVFACATLCLAGLMGRLVYLMVSEADYYQKLAEELHEREKSVTGMG